MHILSPAPALLPLRLATAALLLGHAWQYVGFPPPAGPVWAWYLAATVALIGGLAVLGSPPRTLPAATHLALLAVPALLAQTLASAARTQWELAQLIEHTLQWTTPLWLWLVLRRPALPAVGIGMKLAIALTFTGHGLYALGWPYGRPGHFIAMTQEILGLPEAGVRWYLTTAGILDLIVSVGIFFPRLARPLLLYAAVWGLLTALARPLAYVTLEHLGPDLHRWVPEMLFRLPHSLVPLALWRALRPPPQ